METIPDPVLQLIRKFQEHADHYRSDDYKETQCRVDFIDPMFKALGWDMDNTAAYADAYRDVIYEQALKIGEATKAPDYCFRIGGTRKFFLEAKKPSVSIKGEPGPAFQLRRYAWSAKLPLSILTDFDEFAVYDCRIKPAKDDKASVARILYCTYDQYPDTWPKIASIFSREAILKGSFDKFAESTKAKRGTAEVDDAFLAEIERWRDALARNIALRNPGLSQRDLNFAVQRTIDRIVFLRICEDRGMETYGQLLALHNGQSVFQRLCKVFRDADDKYNSGLFHFRREKDRHEDPDELTPTLQIDDKILRDILKTLYYPESPYEFSVLPADILGQVYEQFLGKVIRLTAGHRAQVEEKPEVRKAGGVYYTPTYIVDYIVKNTVGRLIGPAGNCGTGAPDCAPPATGDLPGATPAPFAGVPSPVPPVPPPAVSAPAPAAAAPPPPLSTQHSSLSTAGIAPRPSPQAPVARTPKEVAKLRILDPACGSGSFLLGAYQYLLDWHLAWYLANEPVKFATARNPAVYQDQRGNWRLTTGKRKEILLNNIHGVDIDPQAVETTKLSLLLKVLEGENKESLGTQLLLLRERALPDLADNIKCGNSLIGPDFYNGQQLSLLDEEERYRINVFDWNKEFAAIMKAGGFDAVIGNPPYIRMEGFKDLKTYLKAKYLSHDERSDLYAYFVERAHGVLREGGMFGMIVSNKFLRSNYGRPLREHLRKTAAVLQVVDFAGLRVFRGPTVRTIVLVTRRGQSTDPLLYSPPVPEHVFRALQARTLSVADAIAPYTYQVSPHALAQPVWGFLPDRLRDLLTRLARGAITLSEYSRGRICRGVVSGLTEAFVITAEIRKRILRRNPKAAEIIKPFVNGRDIRRYRVSPPGLYLIYTYHGVDISRYPAVEEHLRPFREQLLARATRQKWYELQQPQRNFAPYMDAPKIVFPDIATSVRFAFDTAGLYGSNTVYFLALADLYLLALLNSKLAQFYFRSTCAGLEGPKETYLRFFGQYLEDFPVRTRTAPTPAEKHARAKLASIAGDAQRLQADLASSKAGQQKVSFRRQIAALDRQIDQLVYELYGLTDEEIRIVEEATQ